MIFDLRESKMTVVIATKNSLIFQGVLFLLHISMQEI